MSTNKSTMDSSLQNKTKLIPTQSIFNNNFSNIKQLFLNRKYSHDTLKKANLYQKSFYYTCISYALNDRNLLAIHELVSSCDILGFNYEDMRKSFLEMLCQRFVYNKPTEWLEIVSIFLQRFLGNPNMYNHFLKLSISSIDAPGILPSDLYYRFDLSLFMKLLNHFRNETYNNEDLIEVSWPIFQKNLIELKERIKIGLNRMLYLISDAEQENEKIKRKSPEKKESSIESNQIQKFTTLEKVNSHEKEKSSFTFFNMIANKGAIGLSTIYEKVAGLADDNFMPQFLNSFTQSPKTTNDNSDDTLNEEGEIIDKDEITDIDDETKEELKAKAKKIIIEIDKIILKLNDEYKSIMKEKNELNRVQRNSPYNSKNHAQINTQNVALINSQKISPNNTQYITSNAQNISPNHTQYIISNAQNKIGIQNNQQGLPNQYLSAPNQQQNLQNQQQGIQVQQQNQGLRLIQEQQQDQQTDTLKLQTQQNFRYRI